MKMLTSRASAALLARGMYRNLRKHATAKKARNIVRGVIYSLGYGPHNVHPRNRASVAV